MKDSQDKRVHEYMKQNGTITSMDAIKKLKITRLAARISDMRRSGVDIRKETVRKVAEDGTVYHFAEYSLE